MITAMARKRKQLSEQLRDAILDADVSRYRICKDTGLKQAALSRFVNGIAGLSLESIDIVADYLELDIVGRKPSKRKKR